MIRKLAFAAAGLLAMGFSAAPAAAESLTINIGGPGYYDHHHRGYYPAPHYGYGHYRPHRGYYRAEYGIHPRRHCEKKVIRKRIPGGWEKIVRRQCERVYW